MLFLYYILVMASNPIIILSYELVYDMDNDQMCCIVHWYQINCVANTKKIKLKSLVIETLNVHIYEIFFLSDSAINMKAISL